VVVLADLGVVVSEFICSQWEGKGDYCSMGPEADILHPAVKISL